MTTSPLILNDIANALMQGEGVGDIATRLRLPRDLVQHIRDHELVMKPGKAGELTTGYRANSSIQPPWVIDQIVALKQEYKSNREIGEALNLEPRVIAAITKRIGLVTPIKHQPVTDMHLQYIITHAHQSNVVIGDALGLSPHTIDAYRRLLIQCGTVQRKRRGRKRIERGTNHRH